MELKRQSQPTVPILSPSGTGSRTFQIKDPRVGHLTKVLLSDGYLDNEVDAQWASRRLVEELDRMAAENGRPETLPRATEPNEPQRVAHQRRMP